MRLINFNNNLNSNINQDTLEKDGIEANNLAKSETDKRNPKRYKDTPWNLLAPIPLTKTPEWEVRHFTTAKRSLLNTLILLTQKHKLVYATQKKIAEIAGINITTCNRLLKELEQQGWIATKYNGANKSCWYKVTSFFKNISIIKSLKDVLWGLKYASLLLNLLLSINLTSKNNSFQSEYARRCANDNRNYLLGGNSSHARDGVNNPINNTQIISKRKLDDSGMLQNENNISKIVHQISSELNLDSYQQKKISEFRDDILKYVYTRIRGKQLSNPYTYLLKACSSESAKKAKQVNVNRRDPATKPMAASSPVINKVEEKKYTAVELASEISKCLQIPNNAPMIIDSKTHETIKLKAVHNLLWDTEPELTNEPGEDMALMFITTWREKLFPIKEKEIIKKSPTDVTSIAQHLKIFIQNSNIESMARHENVTNNTKNHQGEKVSSLVDITVVDPDEFEEIYD